MRRSNRRRRGVLAAALIAGVLALTTAVAAGSIGHNQRKASCHRKTCRFRIHGQIKGLYPGVHERLKLVVHNPGRRRLTVRAITVRVKGGSAACGARNLHVSAFHGRLRVPAHKSRRVRVRIWMRASSPTACEGHVFRLAFRGRGKA